MVKFIMRCEKSCKHYHEKDGVILIGRYEFDVYRPIYGLDITATLTYDDGTEVT
jgi:hypothetical protein